MKYKIVILLLCLSLFSCEKIFHPEEPSLSEINSYEQLLLATEGIYGKMAFMISPGYGEGIFLPNIKGDDITRRFSSYRYYYQPSDYSLRDEFRELVNKADYVAESVQLWGNLYQVILAINNVLYQFPEPYTLETRYQHLLGELYFLRGYCYFKLTRSFGKIPLVKDIDVDYTKELPSYEAIYNSITDDLELASGMLPTRASEARVPFETPHKGSVKTLLAEVYLNWAGFPAKNTEKYAEAARVAGNLIDSAQYYDLGLLPDFKDVWSSIPAGNKEIAFSISYANPELASDEAQINKHYFALTDSYTSDFMVSPNSLSIRSYFYGCEINFYNYYPESYRKDLTFFTTIYVPGRYFEGGVDTGYVYIDEWNSYGRPAYQKFFLDSVLIPEETYNSYWLNREPLLMGNPRIYLLRFAHTLLTYAEAKARMGELDASAYEAVNRVRRRAHHVDLYSPSPYDLTPGLSAEVFADSVIWERAWEFAGEPEGRWFDILRLEKVLSLFALRHQYEGDIPKEWYSEEDYFFPIPEGEQFLNPNLQ